jgi:hypothetical protein
MELNSQCHTGEKPAGPITQKAEWIPELVWTLWSTINSSIQSSCWLGQMMTSMVPLHGSKNSRSLRLHCYLKSLHWPRGPSDRSMSKGVSTMFQECPFYVACAILILQFSWFRVPLVGRRYRLHDFIDSALQHASEPGSTKFRTVTEKFQWTERYSRWKQHFTETAEPVHIFDGVDLLWHFHRLS